MILISGLLSFDPALVEDINGIQGDFKGEREVQVLIHSDAENSKDLPVSFSALLFGLEVALSERALYSIPDEDLSKLTEIHEDTTAVLTFDRIVFRAEGHDINNLEQLEVVSAADFEQILEQLTEAESADL